MTIKELETIISNDELMCILQKMSESKKNDVNATVYELETAQKARKNKCREFIELLNELK